MKIGIFGQFYHSDADMYIQLILDALWHKDVEVVIEEQFLQIIDRNQNISDSFSELSTFTALDDSYDLFFSIGGDGTLLRAVTYVRDLGIPIVGINTGRLGFLATLQKEKISEGLNQIVNGQYSISKRSLLAVSTNSQQDVFSDLNIALNELAVNRQNTTSMIRVDTWVNDTYLTSYWSDGLIVSTPTGSTGYSLSCGGPVIEPSTQSFVITPIAPHNLNARPFVIPDNSVIRLKVSGREDRFLVSLDSRVGVLENETEITIKKAPYSIHLVELHDNSFIETLRKKLLWGEDKRN
jgi:NAD+ kinase